MSKKINLIFLSYVENSYSRSSVYLDQLRLDPEVQVISYTIPSKGAGRRRALQKVVNNLGDSNVVYVVMSPCHIFVPILKRYTTAPILLDAGWPLSDSTMKFSARNLPKIVQNFVIDKVAFHFADHVLLESRAQLIRTSKKYWIRARKLSVLHTGFNELAYCGVSSVTPPELISWKKETSFILFRGKYNLEAGLERIASILSSDGFRGYAVICTDKAPFAVTAGDKLKLIVRNVSKGELKYLYEHASLALSQMSNHKRLKVTIPHKIFEAIYFECPIVIFNNNPLNEILVSKKNLIEVSMDSSDADILKILNAPFDEEQIVSDFRIESAPNPKEVLSQKQLAINFLEIVNTHLKKS